MGLFCFLKYDIGDKMDGYDSTEDTWRHIDRVNELMFIVVSKLLGRAIDHDATKLSGDEKAGFDKWSPLLKIHEFGTEEYSATLDGLGETLKHHYKSNSHHPEHYENGIDDFCLFDLMEMFVDWKASSERGINGDMQKSINIGAKRFNMSDQLVRIFRNTASRYEDDFNQKGDVECQK